jgi:xanthine dehydrogenase YagR molybdenum-binding subunit
MPSFTGEPLNRVDGKLKVTGRAVYTSDQQVTAYDERLGRVVNNNLAEYHVPTNADVPAIEVDWVDSSDPHVSAMGARGIGELGITGAAAAIANAVFHATGKRVRQLPITPDVLL